MGEILSAEKVEFIKRDRKPDKGFFIRQENDRWRTYHECFLVQKKNTRDSLYFVITAANEKILMDTGDMFIYADSFETLCAIDSHKAELYDIGGESVGVFSSDGSR